MNVSGQVMVAMFAGHAPSLHSLLSIITDRENYCQGMRSHSVDILACKTMLYSLYNIMVRGCLTKVSSQT